MDRDLGHLAVIQRRLDGLQHAIRQRDWGTVEFTFDQVQAAVSKLEWHQRNGDSND